MKLERKDWIKVGVFGIVCAGLIGWSIWNPAIDESELAKTVSIVHTASRDLTYGYVTANKANLVPAQVNEIVNEIGVALADACDKLAADEIKLTDLKAFLSKAVNNYIDEKMDGNVIYKTLANTLISGAVDSAEQYLNNSKDKSGDYIAILTALRAGMASGASDAGYIFITE